MFRIKRHLVEIGIARFLFLILLSVGFYLSIYFVVLNDNTSTIFFLPVLYLFIVLFITNTRKDYHFLKSLTPKYKVLFWIDNILVSIPFIITDYRTFPFIVFLSYLLIFFRFRIPQFRERDKKSIYKIGSLEWISSFRGYTGYTLFFWSIVFVFSCIKENEIAATISVIGLIVDNYVFFLNEPKYYTKQYRNIKSLIFDKIKRMYLNNIFPVTIFLIVFVVVFNVSLNMLILGYIYINLFYLGALFLKISLIPNNISLVIIMSMYTLLFISSLFIPILAIVLPLFILLSYVFAVKNLRTIL